MISDNSNLEEDELSLFESTQPQSHSLYVNPDDNDLPNITGDGFTKIYSESPITPSSNDICISSHHESLRHEIERLRIARTGDWSGDEQGLFSSTFLTLKIVD